MAAQTLGTRVDILEERVSRLEQLPARVDALTSQFSQLRDEMRAEFSTFRGQAQALEENVCRTLRDEIRASQENTCRTLRDEICASEENTCRTLRDEIRAGDARVMDQARVLHEDVVSRLALMQEGRKAPGSSTRRRKR
jgi:predicted phage gp36 major capsid-like protein